MRTYKYKRFLPGNINAAENFNKQINGLTQQLNGQLDQHQIPLESIDNTKLAPCTYATGPGVTQSGLGELNNYHRTTPIFTTISYDVATGDVYRGWNPVDTAMVLQFDAQSGIIKGAAEINYSHKATSDVVEGIRYEVDSNGYVELGVFANGTMVAHSGKMPNGTHCVDLPFCFPVGEEPVSIVVKFRVYAFYDNSTGIVWDTNPIVFDDRIIWCRNQFR